MPIHKRRPWPKEDVEIPLRAFLFDYTQSSFYDDDEALREDLPHRLAASMREFAAEIAEYKDPRSGIWMNLSGDVASYGSPDLTQEQVRALVPGAARAGVTSEYGEACVWLAFDNKPEDVLEAMVLAGWVPSARGIELVVAARRYLDSRRPLVGPA